MFRGSLSPDLKNNLCITDAKSLYDALDRQCLKSKEKQVALVTAEIKQVMNAAGIVPRWIPHNENAVDGLTKDIKKANLKPLLKLLKTGRLRLTAEETEVQERQEKKASGERLQRLKGRGS